MKQNRLNETKGRLACLLLGGMVFLLAACSNNNSSEQWKQSNDNAYNQIKSNPGSWSLISTPQGPTGVFRQILVSGPGEEHPIQTASVTVNYTGTYYDGTVFDTGTDVALSVNQVVSGFGVALQNMVVGDKWNICIPYYLGYGISLYGTIPAYTTLFFEVELLKINQYP